ncbi:hypothetical protein [Hymenobacter yonginensis]|uniref:Uncharacterized protein n=1 Tax=Hymenobacter yonginensis TaxID=748197 RepID=A0ABY7PTN4_9BACT|nr:hypothetical protein [Hymenobacter yonginensis]WBO85985.1 hypothetical protein O9Z63_06960 [Hymenobacter yonginensis]
MTLASLPEFERRCHEINTTHPQYREETPLVVAYEYRIHDQLSGALRLAGPLAAGSSLLVDAQLASCARKGLRHPRFTHRYPHPSSS